MDAAEDKAKELITQGVTTALTSAGVPGPVAGMAARAAVDALTKLPAYKQWDAVRRGVRLLAVSVCPAVENHPDIVDYCVRPLASDYLPDAVQQELADLCEHRPYGLLGPYAHAARIFGTATHS